MINGGNEKYIQNIGRKSTSEKTISETQVYMLKLTLDCAH